MEKYIKKDWHKSSDPRKRLGVAGEDIVCRYIKSLDMQVLERNVRFPLGEIDIVARDVKNIVFIEVKTRSGVRYGRPSMAVDFQKKQKIRRMAEWYIKCHREYAVLSPRIDVAELLFMPDGKKYINYIKAAF